MKKAGSADPPTIRAVVCDLDGTLIDTERVFAEAASRLLAARDRVLEKDFMASIQGTPGRDALPRFRERYSLTEPLEALAAEYKRHFIEVLAGEAPPLMPGALAFLDRVRERRLPCAIATSSRREYVQAALMPHGILPRFDFVLTVEDVTHGKPHPEIYALAAARFGLPPGEVAALEDSVAGCRSALAAGLFCVVIPHAGTPLDLVTDADAQAPRLDDAEMWRLLSLDRQ